jgi:hypothetical protein
MSTNVLGVVFDKHYPYILYLFHVAIQLYTHIKT